ncbi:unnamed protein product [Parascedosporium putredinis]|uniref:Uncharacterized protein n=1 Tax=Parascedosporium putredinis TaxID=1442378 RepID=A0A9P1HAE5_9PEZI|nr:unnamed protein product [Parascedosporium putredinis]CAI8002555.1 unnamed protein product [Parascedosporium putredinis]
MQLSASLVFIAATLVGSSLATKCTAASATALEPFLTQGGGSSSGGGGAVGSGPILTFDNSWVSNAVRDLSRLAPRDVRYTLSNTVRRAAELDCNSQETCVSLSAVLFCYTMASGDFRDGDGTTGNVITGDYTLGDGRKGNLYTGPTPLPTGTSDTNAETTQSASSGDSEGDDTQNATGSQTSTKSGTANSPSESGGSSTAASEGLAASVQRNLIVMSAVAASLSFSLALN